MKWKIHRKKVVFFRLQIWSLFVFFFWAKFSNFFHFFDRFCHSHYTWSLSKIISHHCTLEGVQRVWDPPPPRKNIIEIFYLKNMSMSFRSLNSIIYCTHFWIEINETMSTHLQVLKFPPPPYFLAKTRLFSANSSLAMLLSMMDLGIPGGWGVSETSKLSTFRCNFLNFFWQL